MSLTRLGRIVGHRWRALLAVVLLATVWPVGSPQADSVAHAELVGGLTAGYTLEPAATGNRWVAPWFAFGWRGWTSALTLHNPAGMPLTTTVTGRDEAGGSFTATLELPAQGSLVANGVDLNLPDGFVGALNITGGPLFAVVDAYAAGHNRVSLPATPVNLSATALSLPRVENDPTGWSTALPLTNLVERINRVEIVVRLASLGVDSAEPVARTTVELAPGAAVVVKLPPTPNLTSLTAAIRSIDGYPLAGAALHQHARGDAVAHYAISRGEPVVWLGALARAAGGYSSEVWAQNVGAAPATPELRLFAQAEPPRRYLAARPLQPGEVYRFRLDELPGAPDGYLGAGQIVSAEGAPWAVVATTTHRRGGGSFSLIGVDRGASHVVAPMVYANYAGLVTSLRITNVDREAASVEVAFFDAVDGRVADADRLELAPNQSVTLYLPAVAGLADGYFGPASITAAGGRRLVVAAWHRRTPDASETLAIVDSMPFHRLDIGATRVFFAEGAAEDRVNASIEGLTIARREMARDLPSGSLTDTLDIYLFASATGYRRGRARLTGAPLALIPTYSEGVATTIAGRPAILEDIGGVFRSPGLIAHLIAHEYAHQAIDQMTRGRPVPRWLNEGLANWWANETLARRYPFETLQQRQRWTGALASAMRRGQRVRLPDLATSARWLELGANGYDDLMYAEAVLAVQWLIDHHGLPEVNRLLRQIGAGQPFNRALLDMTSWTVDEFDEALEEYWQTALRGPLTQTGITVLPAAGLPGATFVFQAIAWRPRQGVEIRLDRPNGARVVFRAATSAVGLLDWSFVTTSRSIPGAWKATFIGEQGDRAEVGFIVVSPTLPDLIP